MPKDSRSKRACDRCHSIKERCRWLPNSAICERCCRLNYSCSTGRPLQKAGRKPRSATIKSPLSNERRPSESSFDSHSVVTSSSSNDGNSPEAYTRGLVCFRSEQIQRALPVLDNLSDVEDSLLAICFGNEASVGCFTLGPSFHKSHQRIFVTHYFAAMPKLKDALLSCATILASDQNIQLSEKLQEHCQKRAATAVSSLRSFQLASRQDVSVCLVLGVAITTFALYIAGGEALIVCRYALNLAKPAYESMIEFNEDEISFLICLVFTETIECLFRAETPSLKLKQKDVINTVDRFMGISAPLLLPFHDICCLNASLRGNNARNFEKTIKELVQLERNVTDWTPTPPSHFPGQFEGSEATRILAQVRILQLTLMLIIHRMRYPYGEQDEKANVLSKEILAELEIAMQEAGKSIKGVDLGFMVASFELVDKVDQRKALHKLDELVKYSSTFRNKLRHDLESLWAARKIEKKIYWFNLHEYISDA